MGQTGELDAAVLELGETGVVIGEFGVPGMVTGELGEGVVSTSEGGVGMSEWWLAPMKQWNKCKNVRDMRESKAGRLEDAAATLDTSDCENISDCSEVSHTHIFLTVKKKSFTLQKCINIFSNRPRT